MSEPGTMRIDQVEARVEPSDSPVAQRDDLLAALRRLLPPGRWVRSITVQRDDEGGLHAVVERQTRV